MSAGLSGLLLALLQAALLLGLPEAAPAQTIAQLKGGKGVERPTSAADEGAVAAKGIKPSGLSPVFAPDANCARIASPFGSQTRHDGSLRPGFRFGGLHGGIDLSLEERTPLRAVAAGTVVHAGTGGPFEGIYLWLQHAPEDTGLGFWLYSKYQHLREPPQRALGERVLVGQVVGLSGKTGTIGRAYGPAGYPHLHLTTVAGRSEKFERQGSRIAPEGARMFDPVAIYLSALADVEAIEHLPEARKKVAIPYVDEDGAVRPETARVVWPVGCKRN